MEYILALGVFTFGLFGAFTVADSISLLSIIVCFLAFMQWLFSVGIFANFKDVEYDIKSGIKTTPTIFGVKTIGNKFFVPRIFKIYAYGIKILHILTTALSFLFGYSFIYVYNLPIPFILFILLFIIILVLIYKIFDCGISQRDKMLIYDGLQEGLSFLLIPIVLMSYLFEHIGSVNTLLLIVFMIAWPLSCFRLLFGKRLIPLE
jgi:4-hydroxybenzoate polyprenyltransferase